MNSENKNFFDSKTIIAIVLSVGVFMIWNSWMQKKYPSRYKKKVTVEQSESIDKTPILETKPGTINQAVSKNNHLPKAIHTLKKEVLTVYNGEEFSFEISSYGMGFKEITLNKYTDNKDYVLIVGNEKEHRSFETNLIGHKKPLIFNVTKQSDNTFVGLASYKGINIKKVLTISPETYSVDTKVFISDINDSYLGLVTHYADKIINNKSGGMLSADRFNIQTIYSLTSGEDERENIEPLVTEENGSLADYEDVILTFNNSELSAIGAQYFTLGLLNKGDINPNLEFKAKKSTGLATAAIKFPVANNNTNLNFNYITYMGPKSLSTLKAVDEKFIGVVDLGFFGVISQLLFKILKTFFDLTGNWGFAIILLTLLVKFLMLPLTLSSMKSMKNMQRINPLMKDLRTKYKDDKQQLNLAMMSLYKEHKVNPVGGCLPMLLQIPIYFALYQALGQVVELYHTPFVLWITDLSAKDPYYVLPVLMGIGMFVQQRITPTTMDPAQAKMMQFMPLIFSFLMVSLPSGLTLYITVNTFFTVIQQFIIVRNDNGAEKKTKIITVKT